MTNLQSLLSTEKKRTSPLPRQEMPRNLQREQHRRLRHRLRLRSHGKSPRNRRQQTRMREIHQTSKRSWRRNQKERRQRLLLQRTQNNPMLNNKNHNESPSYHLPFSTLVQGVMYTFVDVNGSAHSPQLLR